MLHNGRFDKEEEHASNHAEASHDRDVVSLIEGIEDESRDQIAEHLRPHVEGPEERVVEALVALDSAIRDVSSRGGLSDSLSETVQQRCEQDQRVDEAR